MSNKSLWQLAGIQAKHIKRIKTQAVKSRQVVLLCETWKKALKGSK